MENDERSKKIVFISHCLLNMNTKAKGKARWPALAPLLLERFSKYELGIEQMPCPELGIFDVERERATKEMYDTPDFRKVCSGYANFVTKEIEKFQKAGIKVMAIVGIAGSPTCGAKIINAGKTTKVAKRVLGQGIFVEELQKAFKSKNIEIPFVDFDHRDMHRSLAELENKIKLSDMTV
jgi:predicted secreted protein